MPIELSQRYVEAAAPFGESPQLITLDGSDHFDLVDPRTREWEQVTEALMALVE